MRLFRHDRGGNCHLLETGFLRSLPLRLRSGLKAISVGMKTTGSVTDS